MARRRSISKSAKRRQLAGSRKGSEMVRKIFDVALTRRRYCKLVGIHPKTLAKWERQRVLEPQTEMIMNSPTRIFSAEDVEFGRVLISFLQKHPGLYSVAEAAELLRDRDAGTRRDAGEDARPAA